MGTSMRLLPGLPSVSPQAPLVPRSAISALSAILSAPTAPILSISGAGLSTPSGLPDYRSPHRHASRAAAEAAAKQRTTHSSFVNLRNVRERYWARSFAGYARLSRAKPNKAHISLSKLHGSGAALAITQNVDGLSQRAGLVNLIELHGTLRRVRCLECGATEDRDALQVRMQEANTNLIGGSEEQAAKPDGDADVRRRDGSDASDLEFVVPNCLSCGAANAPLMPDLVFHGGSVPKEVTAAARAAVDACGAMLVIGSTLMTWSGYSLALRAKEAGKPLVVIGVGETRADGIADIRIEGRLEDVLPSLLHEIGEGAFVGTGNFPGIVHGT